MNGIPAKYPLTTQNSLSIVPAVENNALSTIKSIDDLFGSGPFLKGVRISKTLKPLSENTRSFLGKEIGQ